MHHQLRNKEDCLIVLSFTIISDMLLLQPLWWCCVDCVIHHEWDVREE